MKKLMFLSLWLMLLGCNKSTSADGNSETNSAAAGGTYKIIANITNAQAGKVFLEQINGQNFVARNTIDIDGSGKFELTGQIDQPDFYRLRFYNGQFFFLVLDAKEIKVSGDANDMFSTIQIEGSPDSQLFMDFVKQNSIMTTGLRNLQNEFNQRMANGDPNAQAEYQVRYEQAAMENLNYMKSMINNNLGSIIAPYLALSLDMDGDYEYLKEVSAKISEKQQNRYAQQLAQQLAVMQSVAIGSVAPEIALPSPEGSLIKLSDYRGKYVLIDFWASWCRPCRAENPNVVRMYNKYKGKDFEIFGVSLDKSGDAWKQAIANDGITWPQVSDLQYWQSVAAQTYRVTGIPNTVLIDKEGKIIAKNLRGPQLEQKLAELLD